MVETDAVMKNTRLSVDEIRRAVDSGGLDDGVIAELKQRLKKCVEC